jgi:hypothetical protein
MSGSASDPAARRSGATLITTIVDIDDDIIIDIVIDIKPGIWAPPQVI